MEGLLDSRDHVIPTLHLRSDKRVSWTGVVSILHQSELKLFCRKFLHQCGKIRNVAKLYFRLRAGYHQGHIQIAVVEFIGVNESHGERIAWTRVFCDHHRMMRNRRFRYMPAVHNRG